MEASNVLLIAFGGFVAWKIAQGFLGKVSPDKARELVEAGASLVDVRTPGEHASGHLARSINIPVQELAGRLAEIEKTKPVVVYCASGMRSAKATSFLRRSGFAAVHDLGAMARWRG